MTIYGAPSTLSFGGSVSGQVWRAPSKSIPHTPRQTFRDPKTKAPGRLASPPSKSTQRIGISKALFLLEAGYSWAREPSSMAVLGLERGGPGHFSGRSSARGAMFRMVLASWVGAGQGGWSARGDEPGRDSDQAIRNRSKRCAGARGGARADRPRCLRILAITVGSTMAAMIVKGPPQ